MTRNPWIITIVGASVLAVCVCGVCIAISLLFYLRTSQDRVTSEEVVAEPTAPRAATLRVPTRAITAQPKSEVKLELGATGNYVNSIKDLEIFGEVNNNSDVPVSRVQVAASLIDANGTVVGAGATNITILRVIPAKSKSPFSIFVSKPPTWNEIKFQIQGEAYTGGDIFPPYLDLKTQNVAGRMAQFNSYTLSGTAVNTGTKTAESVYIIAICWDTSNKPVGVEDGYSKLDQIPIGGSAPFEVRFTSLKNAPAKCDTYIQGSEKR